MMEARLTLMKTARCAGWAADVYPELLKLLDTHGVPALDRECVMAMLVHAVMLGEDEVERILQ